MLIRSPDFPDGAGIPRQYTCEGEDLSPSLEWSELPPETRSLVLLCNDPDAPGGIWHHWGAYDIPPSSTGLPEGAGQGSGAKSFKQGVNDFGRIGYGGPCPPRGHGPHRYFFKLYALSAASVGLPAGARRADLDRAMKGKILAEAQYMGRYERR